MKKLALITAAAGILAGSAFADMDDWLQGSIVDVNEGSKTITIDTIGGAQVKVKILPSTRVELDECGWFGLADSWLFTGNGDFWDLEVGRFVQVDSGAYAAGTNPAAANAQIRAGKVEVKCNRRAY